VSELLAELFSSRVRAAVLTLLLPRPHLAFSLTDMSRRLGLPVSSLQHECYKLTRLGLLRDERRGNARLYSPDAEWPLLEPLTALVVRALPIDTVLSAAIERIEGLTAVWLAGDLRSSSEPNYLVVVGSVDVETLDGIFARVRPAAVPASSPGRLELAYFRPVDWSRRLAAKDGFAASLAAGERMFPNSMESVVEIESIGLAAPSDESATAGQAEQGRSRGG
jgi:DNA-binding transcriptional ArsR family regulator